MSLRRAFSLRGIFPPLVTPFNSTTDTIDQSALTHNLHKWRDARMSGYVVLGSNGETPFLSVEEKVSLVKSVVQFCGEHHKEATVIAGAGVESTAHTIDLCKRFADVGAHYALIITPSFYKNAMTHAALVNHYTKISKIARIVAETKNNDFQVLAGSAGFLLPALQAGCVGGVCALANVLPSQLSSFQSDFESTGWTAELQQRQTELIEANAIVTRGLGVAALKHIMEKFDYRAGVPRAPLVPLLDAQKTQVEKIFKRFQ